MCGMREHRLSFRFRFHPQGSFTSIRLRQW
jgi:hypothetical protein